MENKKMLERLRRYQEYISGIRKEKQQKIIHTHKKAYRI